MNSEQFIIVGHCPVSKKISNRQEDREKIVLATKMRFMMDKTNPNSNGLSRKNIISSLERSLERLKTDYVDLYQVS